ncbi:sugar ABC transporter permease [Phycicoccus endophyticus]|uniref:Sugar ABC transporter permease n=1 Tax=Phycicoccus endophyticus TaxID=1690220 RepID=A0A7G9QYN7_9MICO|nr:sugar ABC transporter permease [Phycicoccus endophyticus]NHI20503.1 sugar ABC transporter permease [Phycicoccus endophyticus]QNN48462.1 sugar ABC transporter permease [Phycicoccus endophyticus]GGL30225.1 ABC transporter permease [Phycicoccus endophyticus]
MRYRRQEAGTALLFLAPALVLFAAFVVYPIVYNVQASTLRWDGVNVGQFVGLGNYKELLEDPVFVTTLRNSAWWILLTIAPQAIIGFLLAVALNRRLRGRAVYRAIFFIPAILSPVVVGIVWQRILDPFNGVVASVGRLTGIDVLTQPWLSDPSTAIFAAIFVNVWMWTGFSMLFYLAGLQLIDTSVIEAARIDGATGLQLMARILWPLLRNTHLSLLLLGVIGSLKTFELVYVLTEGGPNHASEMLPTYTFKQAFQLQSVGYASTISVVLLVVAVVSSLSMVRAFGSGFLTGDET